MDGKTPSSTPKTRTVPAHFYTGEPDGSVGYGDESWPLRKGVVYCPLEVGENAGWARATDEQAAAHGAALKAEADAQAKKDKKDDKKDDGDKKDDKK